ncbi:MAG: Rv2231c family pyridoxal phosphate-dependent protein CobC [Sporichthyaceae bacterium]
MLRHHGDTELAPGLVDLAVNVRPGMPPVWLRQVITEAVVDIAAYPRPEAARAAVAARHHRNPDEVLLTAGAAEAFTLIARALRPQCAVVVHPQFTEPELALRVAGHPVRRLLLRAETGFRLDVAQVPPEADLVVLGNPTNPTSRLHASADIAALARPGRIIVVDEAFMDAVPGEPESLASRRDLPGVIVVRSLTKTWGLAGLRVGYVLSEPEQIAALARVQPHWSVSSPALAAALACNAPGAVDTVTAEAMVIMRQRTHLMAGLARIPGVNAVPDPAGPFVLVEVSGGAQVRARLRERGFAVRRGDTFPGLGPDWLRIAVRDAATTDRLLAAWQGLLMGSDAGPRSSP